MTDPAPDRLSSRRLLAQSISPNRSVVSSATTSASPVRYSISAMPTFVSRAVKLTLPSLSTYARPALYPNSS